MNPDDVECWCCGRRFAEPGVVRLGNHPEVALCHRCARWAHRRASERADAEHASIGAPLRSVVRAVRAKVVANDLHNRPVIGQLLRGIDRFLP